MKVDIRMLLGLLGALLVGIFFGFAIVDQDWFASIMLNNDSLILNVFTVAVGGFIGAYSAFLLKSRDEERKLNEGQIKALNTALLVLIRQINAIAVTKRDLEPYVDPLDRAFSLPAMKPPNYLDLKLDIDSLSFLIDSSDPNMLMSLSIQQECFDQAINAINIRNDFYVNEVQKALSYLDVNGKKVSISEFQAALGERLFYGALNAAQNLYDHIEATDHSLRQVYKELLDLSRELHPKGTFLNFEIS